MIVKVCRSGEWQDLELDEKDIVFFPEGLVGCEAWHRFALFDELGNGLVWTLLSIDEPGISLLTTDPCHLVDEYNVDISEEDLEILGTSSAGDLATLCILVVRQEPPTVTANLVGPLVINTVNKIGKQLVLSDTDYALRHPVVMGAHGPVKPSEGLVRSI